MAAVIVASIIIGESSAAAVFIGAAGKKRLPPVTLCEVGIGAAELREFASSVTNIHVAAQCRPSLYDHLSIAKLHW